MGLIPQLSLTQGLLCSPKALKRIRKLLAGRQACIIPEAVTHSELKLCSALRIPMLGPGPRNMALLSSKSNAKKLAQLAELPTGPWAVDIFDEDEFFTSFAGLVVKHPHVRTWLFKIDDERDARGHAYIDLGKMREVAEALRTSVQAVGYHGRVAGDRGAAGGSGAGDSATALVPLSPPRDDDEPAVVGADAGEVRFLLQRHVPKRAVLCNRRVYPDFAAWMVEACRVGAVIQAVPDGIQAQTSVHLQVDPDGAVSVLGTSEAVMSQPFVRAASWFPHTRGSWEVLQETGIRMGRVLAAKGLVGFASVDVVFFDNPTFDPARLAQDDREPTPAIIGGETPVDPQHLMFDGLRSPSPAMSTTSGEGHQDSAAQLRQPPSLPESRQADYELALQLQELQPKRMARDPVSLMIGSPPDIGASNASRYACWVVDVDARLTDEAAALFPLQFIAQVKLDPATGMLRTVAGTQPEETTEQLSEVERQERSLRWGIVSHVASAPGLDKMSYQSLFQVAKMRGVSFDLFHNTGCVFTFLDVFHTLFSLLAVERSAEHSTKRLTTAISALAEGPNPRGAIGARTNAKVAAPRDAALPFGQESEASDSLTITDLQMALRTALKRWPERPRHVK